MKKIYSIALAVVALAVASCAHPELKYEEPKDGETVTFRAVIGAEEDENTKAVLGTNEVTGKPKSMWTPGDKITVFNGVKSFEFVSEAQEVSAFADFSYSGGDFSAESGAVIAVYPSGQWSADVAVKTATVVIPAEQTAVAGSYDPKAAVSVAYSTDDNLRFKNTTALLKFKVANEGIKKVVFEGLGGEILCDTVNVAFNEDGSTIASVVSHENAKGKRVTLEAETAFDPSQEYYIAVLPQAFEKGFAFYFQISGSDMLYTAKEYAKSYTVGRNVILNVGTLSSNAVGTTVALTGVKFTAAGNPGKISGTKVWYDTSIKKTTGSIFNRKTYYGFTTYTTDASKTTQTMTVNEAEGTITGCIPYLNNRLLVPEITMTSGAVLKYDNGDGFTEWDGQSEIDFSAGKIIRVSKNGVNRDYVVQITNTGLPVVVINQPGGDTNWDQTGLKLWAKATEFDDLENNNPGSITIYNADGTVNLGTATSMTRLRGNTSQGYPKKPFAIKLGKKAGLLGMPKHKRWVLLANWKDKSLIRNHIAFGIARTFTENLDGSIPWNVHGQFVEVVYNGVHIGNYYLCEQIKIDENRLNVSDPYEVDPEVPFTGDWTDYSYLLESDDYYDEPAKFTTNHRIPFMFKDDVDGKNVILNAAKSMILDIEGKIYKGYKGTSATGYTDAYEKFDLPSMVDQLLIYEMTMNAEFRHPKSLYTYIDHTEGSPKYGKLCAGPVWDFDFETFPTLGQSWVEVSDRSYTKSILATSSLIKTRPAPATSSEPTNGSDSPFMWYPLLIKDLTFTTMAADRWNKIKGDLLAYADEINRMRTYLEASWECNNSMWPACYSDMCDRQYQTSSGFCGDEYLKSFDAVITAFHTAYMARLDGMNDFVSNKNWPVSEWSNYIK